MHTDLLKASATERRRLLTALAISRASEHPTSIAVTTDQVAAELVKLGEDPSSLEGDFLIMSNNYGWLQPLEHALSGGSEVWMRQEGIDAAREVAEQIANKRTRRKVLRDELLAWLYEQQYDEQVPDPMPADFAETENHYFGDSYTAEEVDTAGGELLERGLIEGDMAGGYRSPQRAVLTEKGRQMIDNDPPQEQSTSGGDNYYINAPSNFAVRSSNTQQNLGASQPWVRKLSDVVEVAPAWLSAQGANAPEARQVIIELQAVAEAPQPDASRARKLLIRLGELIQDAGAGALGGVLLSAIESTLGIMPG
ncbi:hypothetical protein MN0502_34790 (plasmid) [Arthrobacter sp. MN05-02]|nr:hypothetical protein MN0502_34790 [Arthrobacter sp. MN05-02]